MNKFKCDLCDKSFKRANLLGTHKWSVHGIRGVTNKSYLKSKRFNNISIKETKSVSLQDAIAALQVEVNALNHVINTLKEML